MEAVRRNIQQVGGLRLVMLAAVLMAVAAACTLGTYAYLHAASGAVKNSFQAYVPPGYTLIYDANGGSGAPDRQFQESSADFYDFTIVDAPNIQGPDGKVFMGWAEDKEAALPAHGYNGAGIGSDGKPTTTLESTIRVSATDENRTKTLYAVWGTRYTLSFDPNEKWEGSGPVPDTMTVVSAAPYHVFDIPKSTASNTPTRYKYLFQKWATTVDRPKNEEEDYPHWQFDEPVTLREDSPELTLYARYYPANDAALYFEPNVPAGVKYDVDSIPDEEGSVVTKNTPTHWEFVLDPKIPTAESRHFRGWAKSPDATVPEFQPGAPYVIDFDKGYVETLYAVWQDPHRFSMTFHANCDNAEVGAQGLGGERVWGTGDYGPYVTMISKEYDALLETRVTVTAGYSGADGYIKAYAERAGYRFAGWSFDPNATEDGVDFPPGNTFPDYTFEDELGNECPGGNVHNVDVYAVWVPLHRFAIQFDLNNSEGGGGTFWGNGVSGHTWYSPWVDATQTSIAIPASSNFGAYVYKRTGYEFLGWSTNPEADVPDPTYDRNSQNYFVNLPFTFTVPESYNVGGPNATFEVLKLYAVWRPLHRFSIHFEKNLMHKDANSYLYIDLGGSSYVRRTDGYGYTTAVPASERSYTIPAGTEFFARDYQGGYKFLGWSTTPDGPVDSRYAVDNEGKLINPVTLTDADTTCKGGYDKAKGTVVTHETFTLYAKWEPLHAFGVKFHTNGGGSTRVKAGIPEGYYGASNATTMRTKVVPLSQKSYLLEGGTWGIDCYNRTGFKFLGWSTNPTDDKPMDAYALDENGRFVNDILLTDPDPDCQGGYYNNYQYLTIHYSLELYAVWEPLHAFRITYRVPLSYNESGFNYSFGMIDSLNDGGSYYTGKDNYYRQTKWEGTSVRQRVIPAGTVKAVVNSRKDYFFVGWASDAKNAEAGILDPRYELDENGCFAKDVILTCDKNPCNEGKVVHNLELYPVWEPAHTYQVRLMRGDADRFYNKSANWTTNPVDWDSIQLRQHEHEYTFGAKSIYAWAEKKNYTLLGWSSNPNATTAEYTMEGNRIKEPITIRDTDHDNASCGPGVSHRELVLYPVFNTTYTLEYDINGGNAATVPPTQTYLDEKPFEGHHEFEIFDDVTTGLTPQNGNFTFVGWSTSQTAGAPKYGHESNNPNLASTTSNLLSSIDLPVDGRSVKLYAVWYYGYKLSYNANGGSGAPEATVHYASPDTDFLQVSSTVPVRVDPATGASYKFLGWSEDPQDTIGRYTKVDKVPFDGKLSDGFMEKTLYAIWQAPGESSNSSGGSGSGGNGTSGGSGGSGNGGNGNGGNSTGNGTNSTQGVGV